MVSFAESPAFQLIEAKLERIEKVMNALSVQQQAMQQAQAQVQAAAAAVATVHPAIAPAPVEAPPVPVSLPEYHDPTEPSPGDALVPVPELDIAVQERARIDFGKRLAALIGIKNLDIQVAKSLPPPSASHNAFAHSYCYRVEDHVLFVHHNRLGTSGDFGLVVIHALSHIKVNPNDLSNDADPKFLAEFYKNLKILSQDLYKKSAVAQTNFAPTSLRGSIVSIPGATSLSSASKAKQRGSTLRSSFLQEESLASLAFHGDENGSGPSSPTARVAPAEPTTTTTGSAAQEDFRQDTLFERMRVYAQQGGIPLDFLERYQASKSSQG